MKSVREKNPDAIKSITKTAVRIARTGSSPEKSAIIRRVNSVTIPVPIFAIPFS